MTFDAFLVQTRTVPMKGRGVAVTASVALHAAALIAALVFSVWRTDEVAPPHVVVTFAPALAPAPAAPPAGNDGALTSKPRPRPHPSRRATVGPAPPVAPVAERSEAPHDGSGSASHPGTSPSGDGDGNGMKDGTGHDDVGIVDTMAPHAEVFVPPTVARGQLAIDPQAERYRPQLPPAVMRSGMVMWVVAKLCAGADGQVQQVQIIRGVDPALDPMIAAALRTWRYRPWAVDGRPVPFCTTVRYELATR